MKYYAKRNPPISIQFYFDKNNAPNCLITTNTNRKSFGTGNAYFFGESIFLDKKNLLNKQDKEMLYYFCKGYCSKYEYLRAL